MLEQIAYRQLTATAKKISWVQAMVAFNCVWVSAIPALSECLGPSRSENFVGRRDRSVGSFSSSTSTALKRLSLTDGCRDSGQLRESNTALRVYRSTALRQVPLRVLFDVAEDAAATRINVYISTLCRARAARARSR